MPNKIVISSENIFSVENRDSLFKILDSNPRTKWTGGQFPSYVDIKLEEIYKVSKLVLDFSKNGYSIFSVFTSLDGIDFTETLRQDSETYVKGHYEFDCDITCRFIRILIKYNSASSYAEIRNLSVFGEKLNANAADYAPDFSEDFENSIYNVDVTTKDTIDELHSLVARTIGKKYSDCFIFDITDDDKEFYMLSDCENKIKITANSGVNAACGLNRYYKYYCNVHISQVGNQVTMPAVLPKIGETVYFETPMKIRYSYNYCALSYTMAFWNEADWQKELDWLALNGVNVVLDITAQEEVWRRFLLKLGYTMDEVKAFVTGPAYFAWFNMANIYAVGGPLHDYFFKKRTDLARKNHLYMRKMGMMPVLQGYSGMVPKDIKNHIPDAAVIAQGLWNELPRPYMLKTDSNTYVRLAKIFYDCQNKVFGEYSKYFATDPFHEGGKSGRMKVQNISRQIISSMLENNPDSIWIIQSWGENPSKELIKGLDGFKEHALILDLYAEKRPRWQNFLGKEFMSTPWLYCMLNNFGGRMGLHGHLRTLANEVARVSKEAEHIKGIGITPEATHSNPITFDLFFETIWTKSGELSPIDLNEWLKGYIKRRYGNFSDDMYDAMLLLNDTVYNPELNEYGEGAPESVINARPALKIKSASTWGNAIIAYDKKDLEKAVALFARDYEKFCDSEGFMFDLADLLKQILSNTAQEYHKKMVEAYESKDLIEFMKWSDKFLDIIKYTNKVLSCEKEFMLGTWLSKAKECSSGLDEFSDKMFQFNARALITTWAGTRPSADKGGLKDYSNKQWSGLTEDFYLKRWQIWVENAKAELSGKEGQETDWFKIESSWAWLENEYPTEPVNANLKDIAKEVLTEYSVASIS